MNFTARLVIDSDANANCDQTFFLRCFKSCVSFQTWTQTDNKVVVSTTPDTFTGYTCDCAQYQYELVVDDKQVATGPPSTPLTNAFTSIQSKRWFDGKLQQTWVLQQSSASCSASYCVMLTDDPHDVLGVRPSECFYGSPAYYLQTFWWAMVMAVLLLCCCCCFARRRRISRRQNEQQLVGLSEDYELTPTTAPPRINIGAEEEDDTSYLSEEELIRRRKLYQAQDCPSPQHHAMSSQQALSPPHLVLGSFGSPTRAL